MNETTSPEQQWAQWKEAWEAAAWHFTYMDEDQKDKAVLQGGLVAIFYFIDAAQPRKRRALAEIMLKFHEQYGPHLKWGTFGEPVKAQPYSAGKFMECVGYVTQEDIDNSVEFTWSSGDGFDFVGSYQIGGFSDAGWSENVHQGTSYLRIHLPVVTLEGGRRSRFMDWMVESAALLQPVNGYAGLGFQRSYEGDRYEHLEFEHAGDFKGLDVGSPLGLDEVRDGIKSINWLTFLSNAMLPPLGGKAGLQARMAEVNRLLRVQAENEGKEGAGQNVAFSEQLTLHPYEGGVMVQAGEWPQLGWVDREPYPPAYVAANYLLRPARVSDIGGLHYGSVAGEVRFDKHTSNVWLRRFDGAEPSVLGLEPAASGDRPVTKD
ncbi:DUF3396 domain-containing protein [Variovorax sp. ZS18.2.2]|uniref:DUF3396 domain-containing protein n=1 Tax=Variovorax sp. ZS18.2.2 TaxID=2971255 RepID=UPI002151A7AF|nr:DUF3396 domain-containing protein [Variovorax sp. ZS18.2.2]MCR6480955.1 DUF3396 domain-containing protein [Variovorax sp. ZS18.2.2]